MNKFISIIVCLLLYVPYFGYAQNNTKEVQALIQNKIYTFELARTNEERFKGLMFRKSLDQDSGMLFIFDKPNYLSFYMKNTFIALDVAFIDDNFVIMDIQGMAPLSKALVISKEKVRYALEANKGFFKRVGLKIGDKIEFSKNKNTNYFREARAIK